MAQYSVAQAKDSFSKLLDKAEAGEEVVITRRGEVIAELRPKRVAAASRDDLFERLQILRESLPPLPMSAAQLIREMRDEGY